MLAKRWLTELRAATAGRDVLALPYADPDLTALVRHGRESEIPRARVTGTDVIARLLPAADVVPGLAWPAGGYLDRATLAALGRDDVSSVVLDGRALPPTIDLSYTPSGRAQLSTGGNPVAALVADPGLVDLLGRARPGTGSPVLAAQRVVAETAMITAELPSTGTARTIVVMPPRRWAPAPEFLDQLLAMTTAPWAAPVSLRALAESQPPDVERGRLRYPRSERARELPESYLRALDKQQASIDNFAAILTDPAQFVPRLEASLLRLESTWWRGRDSRSIRFEREQDHLVALRSAGPGAAGQLHLRQPVRPDPAHPGQRPAAVGGGRAAAGAADPAAPAGPAPRAPGDRAEPEGPGRGAGDRGGRRPGGRRGDPAHHERRSSTASRCCCTSTSPRSARWRWSSPSAQPSCCSWPPACGSSAGSGPPAGTARRTR